MSSMHAFFRPRSRPMPMTSKNILPLIGHATELFFIGNFEQPLIFQNPKPPRFPFTIALSSSSICGSWLVVASSYCGIISQHHGAVFLPHRTSRRPLQHSWLQLSFFLQPTRRDRLHPRFLPTQSFRWTYQTIQSLYPRWQHWCRKVCRLQDYGAAGAGCLLMGWVRSEWKWGDDWKSRGYVSLIVDGICWSMCQIESKRLILCVVLTVECLDYRNQNHIT